MGGKNKVSMARLRTALEADGFKDVSTFINSGNLFVESDLKSRDVERKIEEVIVRNFKLDSEVIKVRALTGSEFKKVIDKAPKGFGTEPDKYHSDVLFTMGIPAKEVMKVLTINPEVDAAWEGDSAVYFRRLSALRVRSRLGRITEHPEVYKKITIRSWKTTVRLLDMLP